MTQETKCTKERLEEIYDNTIPHSSFLSTQSILSCMYQSYQLAAEDIFKWLSNEGMLTEDLRYVQNLWISKEKK